MKVIVCRKCGKEIVDDTRFCRFCGTEINVFPGNALQQKLMQVCSPENFLEPYDKQKVQDSNMLYQRLMENNVSDTALYEIADQAMELLGVKVIEEGDVERLKDKSSPKNFLNPYNAEKVEKANQYYSILSERSVFSVQEFYELSNSIEKDLYSKAEVVVEPEVRDGFNELSVQEFREEARKMSVEKLRALKLDDPELEKVRKEVLASYDEEQSGGIFAVVLVILVICALIYAIVTNHSLLVR